jgi:hypothetical protein
VNSLTLGQFPWQGIYFSDVPNSLQAIPKPGSRFVEWLTPAGRTNGHLLSFNVERDATNTVTARMEPALSRPNAPPELVITEIQYHPSAELDTGDWVELHNPGTEPLPLAGWIFRDEENDHAFPLPNVVLAPGSWLGLCQDDSKFRPLHSTAVATVGNFKFGLGNSGGGVRLFRPDGSVAVAITYDDAPPWPEAADGGGFTLQLTDLQSDPHLAGSWKASASPGGTPGLP